MQTSIFLAKLIGLSWLILGVAMLLRKKEYMQLTKEFLMHDSLVMLSGAVRLIMGLALVLTHNLWVNDWRLLITILSWLILISGVVRLTYPEFTKTAGKQILKAKTYYWLVLIVIALGAYLTYFGFSQ
jgi:uncharacterized membrane protein